MTDVVERVRTAGSVREDAWSESPEGRATRERAFSTEPNTVPRDRFPKWPALVAAVLVVAIVVSIVVATSGWNDTRPTVGSSTNASRHGPWKSVSAAPLDDLEESNTPVWSGRELVFMGRRKDGVIGGMAFDPMRSTWRPIADSPMTSGPGAANRVVVRYGNEIVVLRTWDEFGLSSGPRMAAYDLATDSWRALPDGPDRPVRFPVATVSDGKLVIVDGEVVCTPEAQCPARLPYPLVYDFPSATWSVLAPVFGPIEVPTRPLEAGGWPPHAVMVVSPPIEASPSKSVMAILDTQAGQWSGHASGPDVGRLIGIGSIGTDVFAFGERGSAIVVRRFSSLDGWVPRPSHQMNRHGRASIAVGPRGIVVSDGRDVALYERKQPDGAGKPSVGWVGVARAPRAVSSLVWAGRRLIGLTPDGTKLLVYTPGKG